jgi:hypothetical protein
LAPAIAFSVSPGDEGHHSQTRSPGDAIGSPNNSWSNTAGVLGSDNAYATANLSGGNAFALLTHSYGFDIPADARIDGIRVEVEVRATGPVVDVAARIGQSIFVVQGSNDARAGYWPTTADSWRHYGGPSELWGLSLTPAHINGSSFGFAITPRGGSEDAAIESVALIDHVRITVFYTVPQTQTRNSTTRNHQNVAGAEFKWEKVWPNPGSNLYSTQLFFAERPTHALAVSGFGFNIPEDATVLGVTARVHRGQGQILPIDFGVRAYDHIVQLRAEGSVGANRSSGATWPNSGNKDSDLSALAPGVYGGPQDRWGLDLTPTAVNGNLRIWISGKGSGSSLDERTAYIGDVNLTVRYLPGPPIVTPQAYAGSDVSVGLVSTLVSVGLDGTESTHLGSGELSFTWSGPFVGGTATGPTPSVDFTAAGSHVVTLEVSDGTQSGTDQMTVTVLEGTPAAGMSPTTATNGPDFGGSFRWGTPSGALVSGGSQAEVVFDHAFGTGLTNDLRLTGFDVGVPVNARVTGIQVRVSKGARGTSGQMTSTVSDHRIQLLNSSGAITGQNKQSTAPWPSPSAGWVTYGGPTDLWGRQWKPSDFNNDQFGVVVQAAAEPLLLGSREVFVDALDVTVFYTEDPAYDLPIADAGPDYVAALRNGVATTRLDGSRSGHPANKPITHTWNIEGQPALTGVTPTAHFTSAGLHQVELVVTEGAVHSVDTVVVTVTTRTSPQLRSPSAATNGPTFTGAHAWVDPHGVFASGGVAANRTFAEFFVTTLTRELLTTGYGFLIPRDATINGIRLDVKKAADRFGFLNSLVATALVSDHHIRLIKGGVSGGADLKKGSWPSRSYAYVSYGGPTQLWGRTWTPADVNRADFGASIQAAVGAHSANRHAYIDHVRITVFYTESEPTVENRAPIADAGADQTLTLNGTPVGSVNLDGTGSSDADDDGLTYTWTGPFLNGDTRSGAQATVEFAGAGQYGVSLEVSDGNLTDIHSMVITVVDPSPPTVTPVLSKQPDGSAGWYRSNVTLTWNVSDPESQAGIEPTGCASESITADQPLTAYTCSAESSGGVTGPITVTIGRDATPPVISPSVSPAANAAGWHDADVAVTWSCTDATSGVASVTGASAVATEGANQASSGICVDLAGNPASATATVNLDRTAPTLLGSPTPASNANLWNNTDVTVEWSCTDALSGVARATGEQIVSAEGANQSRSGTCTDRADNTSIGTVSNISIDRTAPSVTGTPSRAPDRNGWYRLPLDVSWSGNDALSGVASCSPAANYSGPDGANVGVGGTCRDRADNAGTGAVGFQYDATPPVIVFTGNQGSYTVDATVRIACSASDAMSGIDAGSNTCPEIDAPAYTFAPGSHTLEATAIDLAGNVRTESSMVTVEVTYRSLGNLVDRFVSNDGVANSLDQKLVAAQNARTPGAKAGQLRAFVQHLEAVRGRWLTSEHTDLLIRLAGGL